GADLDQGVGVGLEVVEPGRVLRVAALGGDDHEVIAVAHVEQGGGAQLAALGADVVEQQHLPGHAREGVPDPAAARLVGERVEAHDAARRRPDAVPEVEVPRWATRRCRGLAQVYIPPNMPPVTLSVWPWT